MLHWVVAKHRFPAGGAELDWSADIASFYQTSRDAVQQEDDSFREDCISAGSENASKRPVKMGATEPTSGLAAVGQLFFLDQPILKGPKPFPQLLHFNAAFRPSAEQPTTFARSASPASAAAACLDVAYDWPAAVSAAGRGKRLKPSGPAATIRIASAASGGSTSCCRSCRWSSASPSAKGRRCLHASPGGRPDTSA